MMSTLQVGGEDEYNYLNLNTEFRMNNNAHHNPQISIKCVKGEVCVDELMTTGTV